VADWAVEERSIDFGGNPTTLYWG